MIILLIIQTVLLIVAVYIMRNLLFKTETLEDMLYNTQNTIQTALDQMRDIDILGAFESDDEVGGTFRAMERIVQDLATFLGTEEDLEE